MSGGEALATPSMVAGSILRMHMRVGRNMLWHGEDDAVLIGELVHPCRV